MVSIVGASGRTPMFGRAPLAPTMQGAQKSRAGFGYRGEKKTRNQVLAYTQPPIPFIKVQRRRWTFYETITLRESNPGCR